MSDDEDQYYSDDNEDFETLLEKLSNFEPRRGRSKAKTPVASSNSKKGPLTKILQGLSKSVSTIERNISEISLNINDIKAKLSYMESEIDVVKEEQSKQRKDIIMLKNNDDLEKITKQKQLVITDDEFRFGDASPSDVEKKVLLCLKNKLFLDDVTLNYIDVNRLGKTGNAAIISLPTLRLKHKLFREFKSWKQEHENEKFFLNEFLTKGKSLLMKNLRDLKKDNPGKIHAVFLYNGEIFIKYTEGGDRIRINSTSDVQTVRAKIN